MALVKEDKTWTPYSYPSLLSEVTNVVGFAKPNAPKFVLDAETK